MQLRLFYDGRCGLCGKEIALLKRYDSQNRIDFVDIYQSDFNTHYPHIDVIEADKILHGELPDGQVITGLDVNLLAWQLVERHTFIQCLKWPIIYPLAKLGYRFFARFRHPISRLFTGSASTPKACNIKDK